MFAFLSTGTELRRFAKGILPRLAVAVMLFIPLLYGVLYLWAFWDPVGNMNHLPVALVNQDTGVTMSGKHTTYGDKIAKKLDDRQDLKWERTDATAAAKGVKDGKYYFSVTIPKNFSKQAASPTTSTPTSPQIVVKYNDSNSFLASTLGKEAMAQVRTVIAKQFGTTYAKTALVGLQSARSGLSQAADGSGQITTALGTAKSGTEQLNVGLGTLVSGMDQLSSGSGTLSASTQQLASGAATLNSGAKSLASGASQAVSGIDQLQQGSASLSAGNQQLSSGLNQLYSGMTTVQPGQLSSLADGAKALDSGLLTLKNQSGSFNQVETLNNGVQQLVNNTKASTTQLQALQTALNGAQKYADAGDATDAAKIISVALNGDGTANNPGLNAQIAEATSPETTTKLSQLAKGMDTLNTQVVKGDGKNPSLISAISSLSSGASLVDNGINSTNPKSPGVVQAVKSLKDGAVQASTGANALNSGLNTLASKAGQLSNGAGSLASGSSTLSTGASKLASGASTLNSGIVSAATGANTAKNGAQQLADGSGKLLDGSQTLTARLTSGTKQIPKSSSSTVAKQAKVMGNPTVLKQSWLHNAKVFGVGFAPFFMSLAMFVGGIITWLLLRALPTRALAAGVNGWRATLSGFLPAALFGIGQVLIMLGVVIFGLGLNPAYPVTTVLFTLLACFAFLAMQQMFIITMGPAAGRVVALALLMFQLSSSGGTYPVQTTPEFFRVITHIMPITYVVNGLREAITGGIDARFWIALAVLLFVLFGSLIISAISAARQRQWTIARLHPELVI